MDQHGNLTIVGTDRENVDGYLKSTGQAIYGTDFGLPGMLIGKYLRNRHPHARILNIDAGRAKKLRGRARHRYGEGLPETVRPCSAGPNLHGRGPGAVCG